MYGYLDSEERKKIADTLDRFRKYEKGWDSYNAPPIDKISIKMAEEILNEMYTNIPHIAPTGNGTVMLEWDEFVLELVPNETTEDNILGYIDTDDLG
jgi:hypothetical protein